MEPGGVEPGLPQAPVSAIMRTPARGGIALSQDEGIGRTTGVPAGAVFGTAIGVSAFLLFTSEPMIGRLVLPVFGGAAAVWATVLMFFQTLLLLGYLYAHLVATRLGPRRGAAVHIGVMVVADAAGGAPSAASTRT